MSSLLRIEYAESGMIIPISLMEREISVLSLKERIRNYTSVIPNDQILLIGDDTKFKPLDSKVGMLSGNNQQRIFLYDKNTITNPRQQTTHQILEPLAIIESDGIGEIEEELKQIYSECLYSNEDKIVKSIDLIIKRSKDYLKTSQICFESGKKIRDQIQVQLDAIKAAKFSIKEQFRIDSEAFLTEKTRLEEQQSRHSDLLDGFEEHLSSLASIPLHPSLVEAAQTSSEPSKSEKSSADSQETKFMKSEESKILCLKDLLPIEREIAWAKHCHVVHQNLHENLRRLSSDFVEWSETMGHLEAEDESPYSDNEKELPRNPQTPSESTPENIVPIENAVTGSNPQRTFLSREEEILRKVETNCLEIELRCGVQEDCVAKMKEMVTQRISSIDKDASDKQYQLEQLNRDLSKLTEMSLKFAHKSMREKEEIAELKTQMDSVVRDRLREMAALQGTIQPKIRHGLSFLRQLRKGDYKYFRHLELVRKLPENYNAFLKEVVRRKQYQEVFQQQLADALGAIQSLRDQEIKEREKFMAAVGVVLPPVLHEIVPALRLKPQYVHATISENQWLPEVTREYLVATGILSEEELGSGTDIQAVAGSQDDGPIRRENSSSTEASVTVSDHDHDNSTTDSYYDDGGKQSFTSALDQPPPTSHISPVGTPTGTTTGADESPVSHVISDSISAVEKMSFDDDVSYRRYSLQSVSSKEPPLPRNTVSEYKVDTVSTHASQTSPYNNPLPPPPTTSSKATQTASESMLSSQPLYRDSSTSETAAAREIQQLQRTVSEWEVQATLLRSELDESKRILHECQGYESEVIVDLNQRLNSLSGSLAVANDGLHSIQTIAREIVREVTPDKVEEVEGDFSGYPEVCQESGKSDNLAGADTVRIVDNVVALLLFLQNLTRDIYGTKNEIDKNLSRRLQSSGNQSTEIRSSASRDQVGAADLSSSSELFSHSGRAASGGLRQQGVDEQKDDETSYASMSAESCLSAQRPSDLKISFLEFNTGDIAWFMRASDSKEIFVAFTVDKQKKYYLAHESVEDLLQKIKPRGLIWLVGRIFLIEEAVEEEIALPNNNNNDMPASGVAPLSQSPATRVGAYGLAIGTKFEKLYVENLYHFCVPQRRPE